MDSTYNQTASIHGGVHSAPVIAQYLRDPGSAITHLIGAVCTVAGAFPLLKRAYLSENTVSFVSMVIFLTSMFLLYTASTLYHSCMGSEKQILRFKKLDHSMISVLIAGTYTPVCLITLHGRTGNLLLAVIWGMAFLGILLKLFWVTCPKWLSSGVYLVMGWTCVLALPQLLKLLPAASFLLLLAGGILYSIGAVIYALKLSIFNKSHPYFGSHEIFHLFVMAGSLCHYMVMMMLVS
ncbi:MAG: hemolysin III family protein [Clostridiales bacterium]|nr:hemolysin III family protein [Clostridiales bacterium]